LFSAACVAVAAAAASDDKVDDADDDDDVNERGEGKDGVNVAGAALVGNVNAPDTDDDDVHDADVDDAVVDNNDDGDGSMTADEDDVTLMTNFNLSRPQSEAAGEVVEIPGESDLRVLVEFLGLLDWNLNTSFVRHTFVALVVGKTLSELSVVAVETEMGPRKDGNVD
jgi:hypothetical protein